MSDHKHMHTLNGRHELLTLSTVRRTVTTERSLHCSFHWVSWCTFYWISTEPEHCRLFRRDICHTAGGPSATFGGCRVSSGRRSYWSRCRRPAAGRRWRPRPLLMRPDGSLLLSSLRLYAKINGRFIDLLKGE